MEANAACSFAASALTELKPYQQNQRRPVPRATNGMLCGSVSSSASIFFLCGSATTTASAEKPAEMCTTMPPAKSTMFSAPRKPPPQTQWQKGKYTRCTQRAMKTR